MVFFSDKYLKFYGFSIIVLLYIPYIIFGEKSFIGFPFDYLNSNAVWYKIVAESGMDFAKNCAEVFPNIMNQPRITLGSEINFIYLLYKVFPTFWALVLNSFIISCVAFFSFYILLDYFLTNLNEKYKVIISLCFSLLPFWQFGGISVAGFPLVFVLLYRLYKNEKLGYQYLFLLFYTFYSYFIIFNIFLYFSTILFFFYKSITERNFTTKVYVVILILFFLGLCTDYRLLLFIIEPCFQSNRELIYSNLQTNISLIITTLKYSNQHAPPLNFPFLITFVIISIFILGKKLFREKIFIALICAIALTNLLSANIMAIIVNDLLKISFLKGFSLHRFNMVNQILWYFLFAFIILKYSLSNSAFVRKIPIVFVILQFGIILKENVAAKNWRGVINNEKYRNNIPFSDYYLLDEYPKIAELLPKDKEKYKVIHYGLDPVASSYHGYSTVDGFLAIYSKFYEQEFEKMIQPTIDENPKKYYKKPFHNYLVTENYSAGKNFLQMYSKQPKELKINFEILKKLNGKYLISTVPFTNKELLILGEVKSNYWRKLYVYKVTDK